MKKLLFISVLALAVLAGCKKDEADEREKFVGTWAGTQTITIPDLSYTDQTTGMMVIKKSTTDGTRITITASDGTQMVAAVAGSGYTYDKYTSSENFEGTTIVQEVTGSGAINGTTITESGQVVFKFDGQTFIGTWAASLVKQ